MDILIWSGALATLAGIAGLFYCVIQALKLRRSGQDDESMRVAMQRVVLINMAALGVSAIGLMLVILGIFLG